MGEGPVRVDVPGPGKSVSFHLGNAAWRFWQGAALMATSGFVVFCVPLVISGRGVLAFVGAVVGVVAFTGAGIFALMASRSRSLPAEVVITPESVTVPQYWPWQAPTMRLFWREIAKVGLLGAGNVGAPARVLVRAHGRSLYVPQPKGIPPIEWAVMLETYRKIFTGQRLVTA